MKERIIVFTPLAPGEERAAARAGLEVVVGDRASLDRALAAGLDFHLELDTGMGRAGWTVRSTNEPGSTLGAVASELRRATGWRGVFTHFHSADEPGAPEVELQLDRFAAAIEVLAPPSGIELHAANSAGALRAEVQARIHELAERFSAVVCVRPGLHLYGGGSGPELPGADAVVALRARIVRIVDAEAGDSLGYGADYRASGPERWATLAIGYGDGVSRRLSPGGWLLIAGQRVPVIGRISMDMTVANISGLDGVRTGDVATLIGRDGEEEITIDEMAGMTGTISWQVLTGLTPRLPRLWDVGE